MNHPTLEEIGQAEALALKALCEVSGDWAYFTFKLISKKTGLDIAATRQAVRTLASRGYAEFARGLWTEDGTPAGSGYRATDEGRERHAAAGRCPG